MTIHRLLSLLGACALTSFAAFTGVPAVAQTSAQAPRPATAHFFATPSITDPQLAPNGRLLAVRAGQDGRRDVLAIVNLDTGNLTTIAGFNDVDIDNFMWINDERLVFDTTNRHIDNSLSHVPGLFGVNRDGSALVQIVSRGSDVGVFQGQNTNIKPKTMLEWNHFLLKQKSAQDSDFVYVMRPEFDGWEMRYVDLKKVHTQTLRAQTVARPANIRRWLLDHNGEPRIAVALDKNEQTVHYLDPATGQWRVLVSFNGLARSPEAFYPLAFGPDGTLYVEADAGKDKMAVHTFDFATGKISPTAKIVTDDFDFDGKLVFGKNKLLGMHMTTDAESTMWFDPAMKAVQDSIDALLPATVNVVSVGARADSPFVLVESYSDVQPRAYMVYNKDTKLFRKIGLSNPDIVAAGMGKQEAVRFKARDGMSIPGWLTLPAGAGGKNLPLVVLAHDGPHQRGGSWGWHAETQFLASRGYAVLEPEFRGSTGYGDALNRAGFKQWGLGIQNDLADGARWAIAKGIADPKRICIVGERFGGYAALMGLVNDPDLYKCAVNSGGYTDIGLLFDTRWGLGSDVSERFRKHGMPELVGDRVKDAERFKATSPLAQAGRIRQPVLMAYGTADRYVPATQGEQLFKTVKAHNPGAEFVAYPDEYNGWYMQKTKIDFWNRVEQFLDKHIGKP